ncbi:hypothetical protein SeLEV6574_g06644 [Synchytrium endobioticum]|nr:hypothetical protein SeLEV6574_g06644 [Synchytrium endobioticum]
MDGNADNVRTNTSLPDRLQSPEPRSVLAVALHAIADILQIILHALGDISTLPDHPNDALVPYTTSPHVDLDWDMLARFARIAHFFKCILAALPTKPVLAYVLNRFILQTPSPSDDHHLALEDNDQYNPVRVHMAQVVSELQASDLRDARNRNIPTDYLSALGHSLNLKRQQSGRFLAPSSSASLVSSCLRRRGQPMLHAPATSDFDQDTPPDDQIGNGNDDPSLNVQDDIQAALAAQNDDDFDIQSLIRARKGESDDAESSHPWLPATLSQPKRSSPITQADFEKLKSESFETFRKRIFSGGCQHELRSKVWKALLHYTSWPCSDDECKTAELVKTEEYIKLKMCWIQKLSSMNDVTLSENAANKTVASLDPEIQTVRESYHRIEKDVLRTDRNFPFYAIPKVPNLTQPKSDGYRPSNNMEKLRDVLMTYACCASDASGYVQGMSDLASPILYVMNGNEAAAFGCFVEIMKSMKDNFRKDGSGMRAQLDTMEKLIHVADKALHDHLVKTGSINMFFIYRFVLVYFKREFEFDDVLLLWESILSNPYTNDFHLLVTFAIIESHRDVIVRYLRSPDEVLKYMNSLSGRIDVHATLEQAELAALLLLKRTEADRLLLAPLTSITCERDDSRFRLTSVLDAISSE